MLNENFRFDSLYVSLVHQSEAFFFRRYGVLTFLFFLSRNQTLFKSKPFIKFSIERLQNFSIVLASTMI